jgi:hypothetical protein
MCPDGCLQAAEHEAEITLAASRRCAILRMSERGTSCV